MDESARDVALKLCKDRATHVRQPRISGQLRLGEKPARLTEV